MVVKRRSTFQRRPPEYQILLSSIHSCAGPAVVTDDDLKDVLTAIGTCTVPPGEFWCCSTVRKGQVSGILWISRMSEFRSTSARRTLGHFQMHFETFLSQLISMTTSHTFQVVLTSQARNHVYISPTPFLPSIPPIPSKIFVQHIRPRHRNRPPHTSFVIVYASSFFFHSTFFVPLLRS